MFRISPLNIIRGSLFVLLLGLLPEPAAAWGPGIHYYLAHHFLEASTVAGSIGALLNKHTTSFLYGNVVADIIVGKNMIDVEDHSHHWDMGRLLRRDASSDREEAFALGYWTHLAADTVAHNCFLRRQKEKGFSSKRFGHAYWELQAECWVPEEFHEKVGNLIAEDFGTERLFLQNTIPRTVLPFRLNWLIMDGFMHLTGRQTPQNVAAIMDRYASPSLSPADMEEYVDLSQSRMEESLQGLENRITRLNPIGKGGRFLP